MQGTSCLNGTSCVFIDLAHFQVAELVLLGKINWSDQHLLASYEMFWITGVSGCELRRCPQPFHTHVKETHVQFDFLLYRPSMQSCQSWWRNTRNRRVLSRLCTRRCSATHRISTLYRNPRPSPHGCVWHQLQIISAGVKIGV